ncbi:carbamoyl-phosphate synthase L chain ATP-binding protein [Hyphomonas polymorpha PS728]|uniref:Carbamoyl-phosphate synthase L chain ATP-binding protein n=1 Tax=Hyphomonas polymorpha PS728 TaxID=1280954 RepID=A0A062VDR9_9PROT|nr:biotin carboxylase N-terminal domain-containing protein [Hyphomonas polymorpha]KCZ96616.1 carbamoyl-phosphate synthase L chain ATP-binding protein [Hyphomonas polymorpha PS728]
MLKSILIANRGEIACRIMRTARRLGIRTIAVYSDADANALHARTADFAVHIGPSPAAESYLAGDRIIAAAVSSGAEAIHPGYGFLSENAAFANAVIAAGLIWVGPTPESMRAMGLKDAAKKLMQDAGVPTTPGYLGNDQTIERLKAEAGQIGYPVLIKAVAGGGGKGMRKVEAEADFAGALSACQREAKAAFGNAHVLLEKWITDPRHIEVQIFGDRHGNMVHLFERDCTLQRRHQKVIEEAPAPGINEKTRMAICEAAIRAAKAVKYVGAGTVEFIADGSEGLRSDRIWFMEMNTRLQVEHPVTEMITRTDLVEWQLRVASGEPLPKSQNQLSIEGWAMEARIYAESPATGFLPSTGRLEVLELPTSPVRVETGVSRNDIVSTYYDPMIAKLVTHGKSRDEARAELAEACSKVATWPVDNNAGFLSRLLRQQAFADFDLTTNYIDTHRDRLVAPPAVSQNSLSLAASQLVRQVSLSASAPWKALCGLRLGAAPDLNCKILIDGSVSTASLSLPNEREEAYCYSLGKGSLLLVQNGWPFIVSAARHDAAATATGLDGAIVSPMPGRIVSIHARNGDTIEAGKVLVKLEAMKMEHALVAPFGGKVSDVAVMPDSQVAAGQLLMMITAKDQARTDAPITT